MTDATCNVCGRRLTRREFRACQTGHLCDKHRKPLPIPKAMKQRPVPPIIKGELVETTKDGVPQYRVVVLLNCTISTSSLRAAILSIIGCSTDEAERLTQAAMSGCAILCETGKEEANGISARFLGCSPPITVITAKMWHDSANPPLRHDTS